MSSSIKLTTVDPHIYDFEFLVNNLLKEAERRLVSGGYFL
jgi:hypothetical protein